MSSSQPLYSRRVISGASGELDLLLADLSGQALPAGVLVEVGVPRDTIPVGGIDLSIQPAPSFGTPMGGDLAGLVVIVQQEVPIFGDGFESGDTSAWLALP